MKKAIIFLMIFVVLLLYVLRETYLSETIKTINLGGENEFFVARLNISVRYNSNLIILPFRDDYEFPDKINIELLSNNKKIYSEELGYIKKDGKSFGKYEVELDSKKYFNYRTRELVLVIKYNNETYKVLLK